MKKLNVLSLFAFITGLVYSQLPASPNAEDFKKLNWLEGTWISINSNPGQTGYEQWMKISAIEWKGIGVTLSGTDTVFVEKLKLIIKDGNIYYVADLKENKRPVSFRFTEISGNGFTCENPKHDFPKKIVYLNDPSTLKATVSGNGKFIDYLLKKK